jgi:alginate O-acetyltransferase complex protein AlgI
MLTDPLFWSAVALAALLFWPTPERLRTTLLALLSLGYLLTLAPASALMLLAVALVVYAAVPGPGRRRWRRAPTALIAALLLWLALFKYLPGLLAELGSDSPLARLALPLGLSYYVFKLLHFAIESSRGNLPERRLPDYLCWLLLFPAFSAGPIERYDHFLAEREARLSREAVAFALTRIAHGLIKRFVLIEQCLAPLERQLGAPARLLAGADHQSPFVLWACLTLGFLRLYLDFSAYSDVALGASRLFGLRLQENFAAPLLADSLAEFWRRWHMSLTGWCQAYVYLPLLGWLRNPYPTVLLTFLAIGLWHGGTASWLLWGLFHALGLMVQQLFTRFARRRRWSLARHRWWSFTTLLATQAYVVIGSAFIQAASAAEALRVLRRIGGL